MVDMFKRSLIYYIRYIKRSFQIGDVVPCNLMKTIDIWNSRDIETGTSEISEYVIDRCLLLPKINLHMLFNRLRPNE